MLPRVPNRVNVEQAIRAIEDLDRLDAAIDTALLCNSLDGFRRTTGL